MIGFWTAKFSTPMGAGFGVAYFTDSEVFGGDSGFTYMGSYSQDGDNIIAKLRINSYGAGLPSVFGPGGSFDLVIRGTIQGNVLVGSGMASHAPGLNFGVSLTRVK